MLSGCPSFTADLFLGRRRLLRRDLQAGQLRNLLRADDRRRRRPRRLHGQRDNLGCDEQAGFLLQACSAHTLGASSATAQRCHLGILNCLLFGFRLPTLFSSTVGVVHALDVCEDACLFLAT